MLYTCIEGILRFLLRQEPSVSVFGRAFHGRNAEARPISLQIRLAVGQAAMVQAFAAWVSVLAAAFVSFFAAAADDCAATNTGADKRANAAIARIRDDVPKRFLI